MAINKVAEIYLNAANPDQPIFLETTSTALARGMAGSSSDAVDLSIYWVTNPGASPSYSIPVESDTVIFSAKKRPSDTGLIYEVTNWTRVADSPAHYTGFLDLGVASDFWDSDAQTEKTITAQIIVRNADNTRRDTWIFPLRVKRGDFGSETPPDTLVPYLDEVAARDIFVCFDQAQTLTTEQKAQARTNIGASSGSSFDPASPGPIGGTTPAAATFTTTTTSGLVVSTTVSRGGVRLGTSATDGYSQEWKNGSGDVVAYVDKDGNLFSFGNIDIGGSITLGGDFTGNVIGNANTATALETARTIYGQSFNGSGDLTGLTVGTDGSLSAASGTLTVSTAGLLTTAHAKIQGAAGVAGAVHLSHGTTPTGQASTATIYGTTGGIGVIDGTGTAYTLTLGGNVAFTTIGRTVANAATSKIANAALYEEFTDYIFNAADMAATQSGTGYVGLDTVRNESTTYTSTAGVGTAFASFGAFSSRGLPYSGHAISAVPFSKRMEFYGTSTFITGYLGDANSTSRVYIGGKTAATSGTVAARAIGWKKVGGAANVFLSVHNGTSETTVDTGFAPTTDTAFSWRITSDGTGNVVMYVNGTQVATTAAGPSATGTGGTPPFQSIEGVSGNATRQAIVCTAYRIRVYAN